MIKIGTALFEACEELEREKGISKEVIIASWCDAMVAAYKKVNPILLIILSAVAGIAIYYIPTLFI